MLIVMITIMIIILSDIIHIHIRTHSKHIAAHRVRASRRSQLLFNASPINRPRSFPCVNSLHTVVAIIIFLVPATYVP